MTRRSADSLVRDENLTLRCAAFMEKRNRREDGFGDRSETEHVSLTGGGSYANNSREEKVTC